MLSAHVIDRKNTGAVLTVRQGTAPFRTSEPGYCAVHNGGWMDMSDLACWMYISRATIPREDADQAIDAIVAVSRPRNAALQITGALVFSGDSFAQAIEGPAEAVAELRALIARDMRHAELMTVADGEQSSRDFASWSLAYSGTAHFVAREIERIRAAIHSEPYHSQRDLRRLLGELSS